MVNNFKNDYFSANIKTDLICSSGPNDDEHNRTEVSPCPARLRTNMTSEHFTLTSYPGFTHAYNLYDCLFSLPSVFFNTVHKSSIMN